MAEKIQISRNFWAKCRNPGHSERRHSFEKNKKTETYRYYHERIGLEMMFTIFLIASFGRYEVQEIASHVFFAWMICICCSINKFGKVRS